LQKPETRPEPRLEVRALACVRGERQLFRDVSLDLGAGDVLRVSGANGTGKTSLLRMLCGLLEPEQGEVRWRGEAIGELREEFSRDLVYIGHANALKEELSALENLSTTLALQGLRAREATTLAALRTLGLEGREHLPVRMLSQGQRRRAALARLSASASQPLWILDEPFTALDAAAIDTVRDLLEGHAAAGGVLVYTTHQDVPVQGRVARTLALGVEAVHA
jgi:heme exporter protein A